MVNFVQNRANSDHILSTTDASIPYNLENDRLFFSSNVTFKATFIEKKHQISILLIVFVVKTCRTRFLSFFVPQMYLEICRGLCYHSYILLVHTSVQSYCTYLKILINLSGRKNLGCNLEFLFDIQLFIKVEFTSNLEFPSILSSICCSQR